MTQLLDETDDDELTDKQIYKKDHIAFTQWWNSRYPKYGKPKIVKRMINKKLVEVESSLRYDQYNRQMHMKEEDDERFHWYITEDDEHVKMEYLSSRVGQDGKKPRPFEEIPELYKDFYLSRVHSPLKAMRIHTKQLGLENQKDVDHIFALQKYESIKKQK